MSDVVMNDFRAEPAAIRAEMLEAARDVFESGWYVLGKQVGAFEAAWARACGTTHAVGVGNGMDAIEIGLRALGVGAGDEVVTTPMTAFATVLAILRAGATPVLADIDPATGLLDLASVERSLGPATKAVMPVHLYGRIGDMPAWAAFCAERKLHLVEDCAQAHLAQWQGGVAGTFGSVGAYSFYPTKNLGAIGDAGALITGSAELAAHAARLRNYGQSERYHHPEVGMNSRLDELQAALLLVKLKWLEEFTTRRRRIAGQLAEGIRNSLVRPLAAPVAPENHVHHLFVVLSADRERLQAHLREKGVQALIHYPVPMHHQKPCADLRRDPRGLAHTERHAAQCLSLPCHAQMDEAQVARVIDAVNGFR
ncbi:MAG: pyridoxal phosphate-dependent enzyme [Betaproteobacteria bacterium]|nr:pyridoxal phosphate-dependent enzyme [Betaproteobacteria bacterium]